MAKALLQTLIVTLCYGTLVICMKALFKKKNRN